MSFKTVPQMFQHLVSEKPNLKTFYTKTDNKWEGIELIDLQAMVEDFANGLKNLGINDNDKVAIIGANSRKWAISDYAIAHIRAVSVPVYPTLIPTQSQYVVEHSESKIAIVQDEVQLDKVYPLINDANSNQRMINSIFSNSNLNIIDYSFEEDPSRSARNYTTKVFSKVDKFNAAILGVGEDGHIASLFPDTTALNSSEIGFVQNEVNILTRWRVTSTFELLKNVEHIYLLVTGDSKKEIIKKIGKENDLPVNELIRLRKKTVLLTDQ